MALSPTQQRARRQQLIAAGVLGLFIVAMILVAVLSTGGSTPRPAGGTATPLSPASNRPAELVNVTGQVTGGYYNGRLIHIKVPAAANHVRGQGNQSYEDVAMLIGQVQATVHVQPRPAGLTLAAMRNLLAGSQQLSTQTIGGYPTLLSAGNYKNGTLVRLVQQRSHSYITFQVFAGAGQQAQARSTAEQLAASTSTTKIIPEP